MHMQKETITILGCGWLGLPLAKALVKSGYPVKGSTTREENLETLREAGLEPFLVELDPEVNGEDLPIFFTAIFLLSTYRQRGATTLSSII